MSWGLGIILFEDSKRTGILDACAIMAVLADRTTSPLIKDIAGVFFALCRNFIFVIIVSEVLSRTVFRFSLS